MNRIRTGRGLIKGMEFDRILAKHFSFTDDVLDFIINYNFKYRMGSELENGEEEEK